MKTNMSAGIDYSMGMGNVDTNGIHYGVINQHECLQAWADSSEPDYGEPADTDDIECPECGFLFHVAPGAEWGDRISCMDNPAHEFELELPMDAEPLGFDLNDGEYVAYAGEDGDIFVISSPYYTYCVYCSPCAPGAGYLMTPFVIPKEYKDTAHALEQISPETSGDLYQDLAKAAGFPMVYCFGHDFFESEKAPYRIFSITTKQEVRA